MKVGCWDQADGEQYIFINDEILRDNAIMWEPNGFACSPKAPESGPEEKFGFITNAFTNITDWPWFMEETKERS